MATGVAMHTNISGNISDCGNQKIITATYIHIGGNNLNVNIVFHGNVDIHYLLTLERFMCTYTAFPLIMALGAKTNF